MGILSFSLTGCALGPGYFLQAGRGQWALFNRARPIQEVLTDERTAPRIRGLLAEVAPIKAFGESRGLQPTRNYVDYVEWPGDAVVWVVTACDPLRFAEKSWSFPVVGSFNYLGWFEREQARKFAAELEGQGWDVDVRGASAYSTLGWFRDPVLSTMLALEEGPSNKNPIDPALPSLVNVILHESVHATLHVPGQSVFNETLASFLADALTEDYFRAARPGFPEAWRDYEARLKESDRRRRVLQKAYEDLERLYTGSGSSEEKRSRKSERLARLQGELGTSRAWNNASLIQFKTYETGQREYSRLFESCDRKVGRFLGWFRSAISEVPLSPEGTGMGSEALRQWLESLGRRGGCPARASHPVSRATQLSKT